MLGERKRGIAVLVLLSASLVLGASCPRGVSWEEPAPGLDYGRVYYYVPESLDLSARPGLFIFMHGGGGEVNTQPEKYLSPTNGWLRPHIDALPCIAVAATAPHARGDHWRWNHPDAEKEILAIIEAVDAKVPIDRDRIFLGGQSMGGFGAYHLGQVLADRLAGVWAAAGAWCAADFRSMRGTPMFIQHGIYDCAPGYSNEPRPRAQFQTGFSFARAAHELMERDGVEHVFSPYAGGHGLSSPEAQESTRRFVRWASTRRRQPYAPAVTVVTPCGADKPCLVRRTRSHWLEVTGTRPGTVDLDTIELSEYGRAATWSEFEAQTYRLNRKRFSGFRLEGFNRGDNRFEVRAENVTAFRIYLAPQMGDLSRPFTVDAGPLGRQVLTAKEVAGEKDYSAVLEFVSVRNPPVEQKTVSVRPKATDEVLSNPGMGFVVYRRDGNPWTYEPLATPDDTVDWFPCADVVAIRLPWRTILPETGPARWDLIDTYAAPWVAKGKRFAIGIVGEDAPDGFLAALSSRYADNPGLAFVQVDSPAERERWRKALPGVPVLTEGTGEPSLYSQTMPRNGMLSLHWDEAALNAGIEKTRASYFGLRWFPEVLHRNNEELYLGIARRLGYRFELREARFPDVIAAGKPVRIETDWVNVGVARCTVPAFVSYSLLDDAGRVAWTWTDASADLRKAEPKAGAAEKMLKVSGECVFGYGCEVPAEGDSVAENARRRFRLGTESPLQMLKPGVYTLAVSVGSADGRATIALPLEKGANRMYTVGIVTVVEEE